MTLDQPARRLRARKLAVDVVMLGIAYAVYTAVRNAVPGHKASAIHHGETLLRLEQFLRSDPERALNVAVAAHPTLAGLFDYYYASLHFVIVLGVLGWLYWRHPQAARRWAAVWYVMNLIGLLGFWLLPTAPPRLLPDGGFVDTVVRFHTWGSWGDGAVASATNQYAAFPSLHVGWSVWAALAVCSLTSNRVVRSTAVAYPVLTALVVIGTANHYLIDVIAGLATCLLGLATVTLLAGAVRHARRAEVVDADGGRRLEVPGRADWRARRPALILIVITVISVALGAAATAVVARRSSGRRRLDWSTEGAGVDGLHGSTGAQVARRLAGSGAVARAALPGDALITAAPVRALPGRPPRLVAL